MVSVPGANAKVFKLWARPLRDLSGRKLHALDKLEQDRRRFLHGRFVKLIGDRRYGDDNSVALERSELSGLTHDAGYFGHQPMPRIVHQVGQGTIDIALDGKFESQA